MQQKIIVPRASILRPTLSRRDFLKVVAVTTTASTLGFSGTIQSKAQWATLMGLFGGFVLDVLGNVVSTFLSDWFTGEANRSEQQQAVSANNTMINAGFIYNDYAPVYKYYPDSYNRVSLYALDNEDRLNVCAAFIGLGIPSHVYRDFVLMPLVESPALLGMTYAAKAWNKPGNASDYLIPMAEHKDNQSVYFDHSLETPLIYATQGGYMGVQYKSHPNPRDNGQTGQGVVKVQVTDSKANPYFSIEESIDWSSIA